MDFRSLACRLSRLVFFLANLRWCLVLSQSLDCSLRKLLSSSSIITLSWNLRIGFKKLPLGSGPFCFQSNPYEKCKGWTGWSFTLSSHSIMESKRVKVSKSYLCVLWQFRKKKEKRKVEKGCSWWAGQGGRGSKSKSSLGKEPYIAVVTVSLFGILPFGTSSEKKVEYSFDVKDSLPFKLRRYRASLILCLVSIQFSCRRPLSSSISCSITDFS